MMLTQAYALPGARRAQPDVGRFLELVRISALRSLKVRYRGSALGVLWSLANPLMLTVVYTAIFGTAFSRYYDGSVLRYVLSAFVGLVIVTFFMNATGEALVAVVSNGSLLNKIAVPPVIFPLASIAANLFQQALTTFPILFLISVVVTHDVVRALLVPVVLLAVVMLTTGFGLALSALCVFFRDLPYLWQIVGFVLWMTSPMFYPIEVAPPAVRPWLKFNPISQDMTAMRQVAIDRGPIDPHFILLGLVVGLLALAAGAAIFRATRREFMDLL
jgi:ABC-type polysaccharide/polyol phosphate export permease